MPSQASEWNHVGIVLKLGMKTTYIVEWGGGVFGCDLVERLTEYKDEAFNLAVRHLSLPPGVDRKAVRNCHRAP